MRLNGIKCDGCGKYFHFDAGYPTSDSMWQMPDGWLTLYAKTPARDEGKHFCSTECLHRQEAERIHRLEHLLQSYVDFADNPQIAGAGNSAMHQYVASLQATAHELSGYEQEAPEQSP